MINLNSLKEKSKRLRTETYALCLACKDPRVPWYAKTIIIATVGYALSPIDLIPDFIPVLGQLDDLIIVPAGISLVECLISFFRYSSNNSIHPSFKIMSCP